MDKMKDEVNLWIKKYFFDKGTYNKSIYEAMMYSINVGGKRIRPILFLLSYKLFNKEFENAMPLACALEMIHTYSLIHDDLPCMDNDDLRRGEPTCHKKFNEATAVLAGDGLLNEAMIIMFNQCLDGNVNTIKACKLIAESSGVEGMIGGQVVDMESEGKKIDENTLNYMHQNKTGALIKASILGGAILAEAEPDKIGILEKYSEKLGLAFQIKDDILDVIGDANILGKSVNSDAENNKTNFVTMYGLDECKNKCDNLTNECIELLKSLKMDTEKLEELTIFLLERNY
jgi:geranylgeranyl diphosphate synthase type II